MKKKIKKMKSCFTTEVTSEVLIKFKNLAETFKKKIFI